jgi:hypothetical protein
VPFDHRFFVVLVVMGLGLCVGTPTRAQEGPGEKLVGSDVPLVVVPVPGRVDTQ